LRHFVHLFYLHTETFSMITNIDQKSSGLDFKLAFFGKNFLSRSNSLTRRSFYAKMLFVNDFL